MTQIILIRRFLAALARDARGVAATELAVILPVVLVLIIGVTEVGRAIFLHDRLNVVASRVADLATREPALTPAKLDELFRSVPALSGRPGFDRDEGEQKGARIVVSAIVFDRNGRPSLSWQHASAGDVTSRIMDSLPRDFRLGEGEAVIAVEVFYGGGSLLGLTAHETAFARGRMSELSTLGRG